MDVQQTKESKDTASSLMLPPQVRFYLLAIDDFTTNNPGLGGD